MFPLEKVDANSDIQRSHINKLQSLVLNQNAIKFSDEPKCDKISLVTESSSSRKKSAMNPGRVTLINLFKWYFWWKGVNCVKNSA